MHKFTQGVSWGQDGNDTWKVALAILSGNYTWWLKWIQAQIKYEAIPLAKFAIVFSSH